MIFVGYDIYLPFKDLEIALWYLTTKQKTALREGLEASVPYKLGGKYKRTKFWKESDLVDYFGPDSKISQNIRHCGSSIKIVHFYGKEALIEKLAETHTKLGKLYADHALGDCSEAEKIKDLESDLWFYRETLMLYIRDCLPLGVDKYDKREYQISFLDKAIAKAKDEHKFDEETWENASGLDA